MEKHKLLNSLINPKQKEQCCRRYNAWPQIVLQHHSDKASVVLAQRQTELNGLDQSNQK